MIVDSTVRCIGGQKVGASLVGGFKKAHLKLNLKANQPSSVTNCDKRYYKLRPVDIFQTVTKSYYELRQLIYYKFR